MSAAHESDTVTAEAKGPEPMFSVVKGQPTDEELAALVVVLSSRRGSPATGKAGPPSQWAAYWRGLRAPITPGPGAWRQSTRLP